MNHLLLAQEPEIDSKIRVLYEDDTCIAVEKSGNCPMHEGGLYKENCFTHLVEKELHFKPYIIYRLDRETSGIVLLAKKGKYVRDIFNSIELKEYTAVCKGAIEDNIVIDSPIGETKGTLIKWKKCVDKDGKHAKTFIMPKEMIGKYTIITAMPITGRQHQIRVHLSSIGYPIVGDKLYENESLFVDYLNGKKDETQLIQRQALHLGKIKFDGKEIECPMPEDMKKLIQKVKDNV
jgi:23S rRNA pseudouridine1911/1915/1917 synthase